MSEFGSLMNSFGSLIRLYRDLSRCPLTSAVGSQTEFYRYETDRVRYHLSYTLKDLIFKLQCTVDSLTDMNHHILSGRTGYGPAVLYVALMTRYAQGSEMSTSYKMSDGYDSYSEFLKPGFEDDNVSNLDTTVINGDDDDEDEDDDSSGDQELIDDDEDDDSVDEVRESYLLDSDGPNNWAYVNK